MLDFHFYNVIKTFGIVLCSLYIYKRAMNCGGISAVRYICAITFSVAEAFLYAFSFPYIPLASRLVLLAVLGTGCLCLLTRARADYVLPGYLLSLSGGYIFLFISSLFVSLIYSAVTKQNAVDGSAALIVVCPSVAIQSILIFLFFRIRRLKKGFSFLLGRNAIVFALFLFGIILLFVSGEVGASDNSLTIGLGLGITIIGGGLYILIRRLITMAYRRRLKEQGAELDSETVRAKDEEIARLTEQNRILSEANHRINRRLSALERAAAALAVGRGGAELAPEYGDVLDEARKLDAEYQGDLSKLSGERPLPATNVAMIDLLFGHFAAEARKENIDFKLRISGNIHYMVEHIIPENRLETMIGDHIQDALIAIGAGDNPFRGILVIFGAAGGCYGLTVYDSGAAFEAETLQQLGLRRVTTHGDSGGSGIGFMTTFDALKAYRASLIIAEKPVSPSDYTKSVAIRFDGKGRYVVKTYRADAFSPRAGMTVEAY